MNLTTSAGHLIAPGLEQPSPLPGAAATVASPSPGNKTLRVVVLFQRIGPYHFARLRAAARHLSLTALELSNVDSTYAWDLVEGAEGFHRVVLFSGIEPRAVPHRELMDRMSAMLDRLNPQVVAIPGWADRGALAALWWCRHRSVPVVLMSETTAWDERRRGWKEWIKRRVIRLTNAALVGGVAHANYLRQLDYDQRQIFCGYDAVDNEHFATRAAAGRARSKELRRELQLPENYFLASARFVEKKNLPRLLDAYARYRQLTESRGGRDHQHLWDLVLLGDGPLKAALCAQISHLNLSAHIHLPGFQQYDQLPCYYGLARGFVHASSIEPWGLVVNEAMAAGLPVLVSDRCGCVPELVQPGVNGFTFDPQDTTQIAEALWQLASPHCPRAAFGTASRRLVGVWGAARFATGLAQAAQSACHAPDSVARWGDRFLLRLLLAR